MQLEQIWIYPLKSARGISVQRAQISHMGLEYDRRWMLVDAQGQFLSQRTLPQMAKLGVSLTASGLRFDFESESHEIPLPPYDQPRISVRVWRSQVQAQIFDSAVTQWFRQTLQADCRLVYLPDDVVRATNPDYAPGKQVSFADGYPYLIANLSSLDALNQQLQSHQQQPIGIDRFRANFVVSASVAFEEDHWHKLQIGQHGFEVVKPCERCVIITTDQQTGERNKQVLTSLSQIHQVNQKVIFGQNLTCESQSGELRVGDSVFVA